MYYINVHTQAIGTGLIKNLPSLSELLVLKSIVVEGRRIIPPPPAATNLHSNNILWSYFYEYFFFCLNM